MALGSTQPLTEMSSSNLPRGKGQQAHEADNLTASELIEILLILTNTF
jgi:hypothetical protein